MKYGLNENEFDILMSLAVDPLKEAGARVWIFGSRARGDHRSVSDVDLMYSFGAITPPRGLFYRITTDLEESRLPFKVDLVAEDSIAASYRAGALQDRLPL